MPTNPLKSFDACVWAKSFIEHVNENPSIAMDEATMTTWFANAIMRGYDEYYWKTPEYKRRIRRILYPWWHWRHWIPTSTQPIAG